MRDRQQAIWSILSDFQGLDSLKQLFWSELNYDRVDTPLSRRDWPPAARDALREDPRLFAKRGDFHVVYGRLHSPGKLHITHERAVVNRLLRDHPLALFVFSDAQQRNWHFVNVKYDSQEDPKDPKKRRLFRRISIGPDERYRTASQRIAMVDVDDDADWVRRLGRAAEPLDVQTQHDKAFDVEAVTQEFYKDYEAAFRALEKDLHAQTRDAVWAHEYALQFLNRVMFLYFVQRKRWLGDNPEFLKAFWDEYRRSDQPRDTFFRKWLSVLFFEAFNNKFHGGHRQFPKDIRDALQAAPYLNGGLFEQNDLDRRFAGTLNITDDRFRQAFDFFEGYNFTIAEDSPLDQEVAVDPEMIGKVYESLVNVGEAGVDERGRAGIFYTARTEIELMCRVALVDNLANHLGEEHKDVLYEAVFALEKEDKEEADQKLAHRNLWPDLDRHLRQITVVDPACGSGSFLVGMLSVLADLGKRANRVLGRDETPYELKKRIIGQSLYGVDVMEWAVHVAELRLWLQLVIDTELELAELKFRPLLPNLSFKVRCGDSLVQEVGGVDLSHIHGRAGLSASLKGRLTKLKGAKLRFYSNDPAPEYSTKERMRQAEHQLVADILRERAKALADRRDQLRIRIEQPAEQLGLAMPDLAPAKARQLQLQVAEWRRELESTEEQLAELQSAREALAGAKEIPFVWDIAFVEVFEEEKRGFDVVIGNPPYVRQERIAPPAGSGEERREASLEQRREYKAKLARSVHALYPRFFGYNPSTGEAGRRLGARCDLYIYFYFHGLSLLNERGSFCFITSNSWLDVGYGKDLQEFLLRQSHVKLVLDNQVKRSFAESDINTVIVLLGAPSDERDAGRKHTARFVMCTVPFEQILSPVALQKIEEAKRRTTRPEFRVHPKDQRALLEEGLARDEAEEGETRRRKRTGPLIKVGRYEGNKWGGKYLRAPDIYWRILEKAGDKLVRLGDIAEVRFGIKTGANDFFYVRVLRIEGGVARVQAGDGSEHEVEARYLRPAAKSPRAYYTIRIPERASDFLFWCRAPAESLTGSAAARYVKWGEARGFHKRPTCRARHPWYAVRGPEKGTMLWPSAVFERHICYECPEGLLADKVFYVITSPALAAATRAFLNSAVVALLLEVEGYVLNHGGVFQTTDWVASVPVITEGGPQLCDAYESVCARKVLLYAEEVQQHDRVALDSAVLDALGLSPDMVHELHRAVSEYVADRITKARRKSTQVGRRAGGGDPCRNAAQESG